MSREEWAKVDDMLHEVTSASSIPGMRCSYCRGYLNIDADGESTCLNCGRSALPRRELGELVERLAGRLIEYRNRQN